MVTPHKLSQLTTDLTGLLRVTGENPLITGITSDSRLIQPGFLFVAVKGENVDGHKYIFDAIQAGAVAVVGQHPQTKLTDSSLPVPYIQVENSQLALAHLSAALNGFPAHEMTMIGVTGTDGKTTTVNLIYQILLAANIKAGMISSINAIIGDQMLDTGFHVTTPDAPDVQAYLSQMHRSGLTHVVLEATSHGLAQNRVAACEFDLGVVTNITHEHLDYHGTYEAYREAKGILFSGLAKTRSKNHFPPRGAVLNRDDSSYDYLLSLSDVPVLSYGLDTNANVIAKDISYSTTGFTFVAIGKDLRDESFEIPIQCHLQGKFNLYNCLAAIALTRGVMYLDDEAIKTGIDALQTLSGRMESIDMGQDYSVIVDFAHTPNALRTSLTAARQLTTGRLIAIFGSAGLRDRKKRRMMAEISAELADITVLTAEDPRTESLTAILEEMAEGARSRGAVEYKEFWRIADRREAIRFAVGMAKKGDLLIACGKGHEQSMCYGDVEYPWDDRIAFRSALAERLNIPGPEMPFLPDASS